MKRKALVIGTEGPVVGYLLADGTFEPMVQLDVEVILMDLEIQQAMMQAGSSTLHEVALDAPLNEVEISAAIAALLASIPRTSSEMN